MNKLMYTRVDGGVSIVVPATKESVERVIGPLTDEEFAAHVRERSIPKDALNVVELDDADLPQDREFRDAWKQTDKKVDFDLEKARNIQLDRIRIARAPKFTDLDVQSIRAQESGDSESLKKVLAQKQALRDITEPLKGAKLAIIEDVKNAFPAELRA